MTIGEKIRHELDYEKINKARLSIKFMSPRSEASRKKAADSMLENRKYRQS